MGTKQPKWPKGGGMRQAELPGAQPTSLGLGSDGELAALYRLTDTLYRAKSLREVYDAALDAILGTMACERAAVLLFNDAGVMNFVTWRGLSQDYRNKLTGHSPWLPGTRDPHPIFVSDIDQSAEPEWVKATVRKENIRATTFIPLVADGETVGKFMTYYAEPRIFDSHEVELAVTIARQVGFSLERARADKRRRGRVARIRGALPLDVGKRAGDDLDERCARRLPASQSDAARVLECRRGKPARIQLAVDDASGRRARDRAPDHGSAGGA